MYICIYACVCVYVGICVCMCMYIYTYISPYFIAIVVFAGFVVSVVIITTHVIIIFTLLNIS